MASKLRLPAAFGTALVGAGVNVQWCARFATYVYYDGVLGRNNYDNNAVSGGFRFGF